MSTGSSRRHGPVERLISQVVAVTAALVLLRLLVELVVPWFRCLALAAILAGVVYWRSGRSSW